MTKLDVETAKAVLEWVKTKSQSMGLFDQSEYASGADDAGETIARHCDDAIKAISRTGKLPPFPESAFGDRVYWVMRKQVP